MTTHGGGGDISALPEGCIANVVSFTSPEDACRICTVSTLFRSAGGSDSVWEKFLPPDYESIISESSHSSLLTSSPSKKHLFLTLCRDPILIDNGKKSFWLDKWSGTICYMISSRNLHIAWGDEPRYWNWTPHPISRFTEVAVLVIVCWLEIGVKINTSTLSPSTHYVAYLVFKLEEEARGFVHPPSEVTVGVVGGEASVGSVCLDLPRGRRARQGKQNEIKRPRVRGDGWWEVELGDFYNKEGEDAEELEMKLMEVKGGHAKRGLVVEGIEIRVKRGH